MKICPANINFCASYVNSTKVKRWNDERCNYDIQNANFLRYDKKNENDFATVSALSNSWYQADFIIRLYNSAKFMAKGVLDTENTDLYFLTSQSSNFDKLDADKVFGMAEVISWGRREAYLSILQAMPSNLEYKRIGSGILDCLKDMYDKIILSAANGTDDFYKKNGFIPSKKVEGKYVWKRPLRGRISRFFSKTEN